MRKNGYLIYAIGFGQFDLYFFGAGAGDIFADIISPDRQFAVSAVNQNSQLNGAGTAKIDQSIQGGAGAASGIENIIHQDDSFTVDIGGNLGSC